VIQAVVFDLDGVLLDSELLWDRARRQVVAEQHGRWTSEATADMQGMSSPEWSLYMRERLGVDLEPPRVADLVVHKVLAEYDRGLPLLPGALQAVRRLAQRWPLGLASSANRVVIDRAMALAGVAQLFGAVVSSEEVGRGKPAPDVYLEAARRLGVSAASCAAVEDSANGIRSAVSASMRVVAVPNREYPPPKEVLDMADRVVPGLDELTVELLSGLDDGPAARTEHRLDEEERQSFPASDPHSEWAGP